MSESEKKHRRRRRSFNPEFQRPWQLSWRWRRVSLLRKWQGTYLELTETAFGRWVELARTDKGEGKTLEFDTPAAKLQQVPR